MKIKVTGLIIGILCLLLLGGCGGGGGSADSPESQVVSTDEGAITGDVPEINLGAAPDPVLQAAPPYVQAAVVAGTPPPQGASGAGTLNSWYVPAKAFDGNCGTWWVGEVDRGSWDLFYGFPAARTLQQVSINFYGPQYVPGQVALKVSSDGVVWTDAGNFTTRDSDPVLSVEGSAKYIWIQMTGNPDTGYPLIRDVDWLPLAENWGISGGPGANDDWYFPDNAFDGKPSTWWVGAANAGAWDLYYAFDTARFIPMIAIQFYNINYKPSAVTIRVSEDGMTWTDAGATGPGANTTPYTEYFFANRTVRYLNIQMRGTPPSKAPIIKDISMEIPLGASSGNSKNTSYKAANAFDGNPSTWWVGDPGVTQWDLIYRFTTPGAFKMLNVTFYSLNHMPGSTMVSWSDDGITWDSGFPLGSGPDAWLMVPHPRTYLRIHMQGVPVAGAPLIRDIAFSDTVPRNAWIRVFPGSTVLHHNMGFDVQQTTDGGYITGGNDNNAISGTLLKLDMNGNIAWQKTYTHLTGFSCQLNSVQQTVDAGFIAAGWSRSTDPVSGESGSYNMSWVMKTDAQGTVQWSHVYDYGGRSQLYRVRPAPDGGYIAVGYVETPTTIRDVLVLKIDAQGTQQWIRTIPGPGPSLTAVDEAWSVTIATDGGFVIAANTESFPVVGRDDIWLLKLNPDGSTAWQQIYGDAGNVEDTATFVLQTADGGYVISGHYSGIMTDYSDLNDFMVLKVDASGNQQWMKTYNASVGDMSFSIREYPGGGFLLAGKIYAGNENQEDPFYIRLDASGNELWRKRYLVPGMQNVNSMDLTADGGSISLGSEFFTGNLTVLKLDANGECPGCGY